MSLVVLLAMVVGCAPGSASPTGAELWRVELSNAVSDATSDWEREILQRSAEQGFISDEDFAYAEQQMMQCMADRGIPMEKVVDPDTGLVQYETGPVFSQGDEVDTTFKECSRANGLSVRSLYNSMRRNPDFGDPDELMAACLVAAGLVEPGYSGEDFDRDMLSDQPSFDQEDKRFIRCYVNPTGA